VGGKGNVDRPAVELSKPPLMLMRMANPVVSALLRSGRTKLGNALLLVSFVGRKTGRRYSVPVGYRHLNGKPTFFTDSRWGRNLLGGADITVVLGGRERAARAQPIADPDQVAELTLTLLREVGRDNANRLGLKVNVDREPTLEEIKQAIPRRIFVAVDLR
jgi:hypothetical protein